MTKNGQKRRKDYEISTRTLRGERDRVWVYRITQQEISTHTLRGERDLNAMADYLAILISTHTLRGERDNNLTTHMWACLNFNSHAPWGA